MRRLILADGSSWPRPSLESDEQYGLAHKLRYGESSRADILAAAEVISAYEYLVVEVSQRRRNEVCSEIKMRLKAGE